MNIFVDFDLTIAGGHSGGYAMDHDPMDSKNKMIIETAINKWLKSGCNVIIVTRGIDTHIDQYLMHKLIIKHTMNSYSKGILSVYAPDEKTFNLNGSSEFALLKTEYVRHFLNASKTLSKNSFFIDDTSINVQEMKSKFPDMTCVEAIPSKYLDTVSKIDNWIKSHVQDLRGGKKKKSSKLRKYGSIKSKTK